MRSSTSASEGLSPSRAIVLLLVGLAAYFLVLELFARDVLPRLSENQRRIAADNSAALALRPRAASGATTVLLVGNSLLLHSIDRERLAQLMGPQYQVTLYPVEGTAYLDWAYGLRRLFAGGSRPAVVVLCISAKHVLADVTAGEGFAYLLMRLEDLPGVVRESHLNMMNASAYFFANLSGWLGTRTTFRDGLMLKWLPDAQALADRFIDREPVHMVADASSLERAVQRLQSVDTLTAQYGARFIWLEPPTLNLKDIGPELAAAANAAHVPALMPSLPGTMAHAAFLDGFHTNARGAAEFTQLTADALQQELAAQGPGSGQPR